MQTTKNGKVTKIMGARNGFYGQNLKKDSFKVLLRKISMVLKAEITYMLRVQSTTVTRKKPLFKYKQCYRSLRPQD